MKIVNTNHIESLSWSSPAGKFAGSGKQISEALGREPNSTDLMRRHPFDVEILTIAPGQTPYPYHSHSAQWEYYQVLAGCGVARDETGHHPIRAGDAFLFPPGEAHQLINNSDAALVVLVVADNPIGESCYYPDSNKWLVRSPERRLLRSDALLYWDGEE